MHWLSIMLDNIFFQTSWNDVFLYTFIIYITRSEVRPITSKNPRKRRNSTRKRGKLQGETAETARKKGKSYWGKQRKQHGKKGKLAGKNGKDDWKYRERNRGTPARLQKSKGPGTANFRKKFRNKRKTIQPARQILISLPLFIPKPQQTKSHSWTNDWYKGLDGKNWGNALPLKLQ